MLGSFTHIYTKRIDTIAASGSVEVTDTVLEGNKYDFYIDGIIITIGTISDPYSLLITFTLLEPESPLNLLTNFPYSNRGTRNNPNYIAFTKATDVPLPLLHRNNKFYLKLENFDTGSAVEKTAITIHGYPVISEEKKAIR